MPETVKPLLPVQINYTCDVCGDGLMVVVPKQGLSIVGSATHEIPHECNQCQHMQSFAVSYPYIHYTDFMGFVKDSHAVIKQLEQQRCGADHE